MFSSAGRALRMIFEPALFGVVLNSFLLSFLIFAVLFVGAEYGVEHLLSFHWPWLNALLALLAPVLVIVLAFFLGAPVAAIFASLYLNRIAEVVEAKYYAGDGPSAGTPFFGSVVVGLRLSAWVVVLALVLLPVEIAVPILGSLASLVVNAGLLGREYFELAALRHLPREEVDTMRRRHRLGILGAGLVIAGLAEIPFVNFLAPLYGAVFMVHVFRHFQRQEGLA